MGTTVSFNRGPRTVDPKAKPSCAPKHRRPFFVYLELECIGKFREHQEPSAQFGQRQQHVE